MERTRQAQRAAMKAAHRWVASVIHGALSNGSADNLGAGDDEAEYECIKAAIITLADRHDREAIK